MPSRKQSEKTKGARKSLVVPFKMTTRSRGKVDDIHVSMQKHDSIIKRRGGGNGIPGRRRYVDVKKLKQLAGGSFQGDLTSIIKHSRVFRESRKAGKKIDNQKFAETHNRQVVYPNQMANTSHSLHVGQDIAAVFNSNKSGGNRVYDYPDLAEKLDKRMSKTANRHGDNYFSQSDTATKRRAKIAQGMGLRLNNDFEGAQKHFAEIGLTQRGQKWVDKFSTVLLAEKARELDGASKGGLINKSLEHLRSNSFKTVFVTQKDSMAPFAGKGGASEFKK